MAKKYVSSEYSRRLRAVIRDINAEKESLQRTIEELSYANRKLKDAKTGRDVEYAAAVSRDAQESHRVRMNMGELQRLVLEGKSIDRIPAEFLVDPYSVISEKSIKESARRIAVMRCFT